MLGCYGFTVFYDAVPANAYLTQPQIAQGFANIGFTAYFRIELAVLKFNGVAIRLLPVSGRLKEWTYAGFGITFISGFIPHSASGDRH